MTSGRESEVASLRARVEQLTERATNLLAREMWVAFEIDSTNGYDPEEELRNEWDQDALLADTYTKWLAVARAMLVGDSTPGEAICICPRFTDLTEGTIIADLTCPIHGVDGTEPGDVLPGGGGADRESGKA